MNNKLVALMSISLTLNLVAGVCGYMTVSNNYHLMQLAVEKPSSEEVELSRIFNN